MKTIGPSRLARIMECAGSLKLEGDTASLQSSNALEGEAVHEAAELVLTGQAPDIESLVDRQMSNGVFITADMAEHLAPYIDQVSGFEIERQAEWAVTPDTVLRGTTDAVRVFDGDTLSVYDLKYGWRVVEPQYNWQLVAYAILNGGLTEGISKISMTIYQPRPYHPDGPFRTWIVTREQLTQFAHRIQSRIATLDDELATGAHCLYCNAAARCPALRNAASAAIDVVMNSSELESDSGERIASLLDILQTASDRVKLQLDALEGAAMAAIERGETVPGHSVTPAFGRKKWKPEATPELVEVMTARQDLSERKLITPVQAAKRGVPDVILKTLTVTPSNGLKLTRVSENDAANAFQNAAKKG